MGTRSIWTFAETHEWKDEKTGRKRKQKTEHHVYKHWDGYPTGAALIIARTLLLGTVWQLPRFEADEFAAGFIAANKDGTGDFRLALTRYGACDVEYGYTIWFDETLKIRCVKTGYWGVKNVRTGEGTSEREVFDGTVWDFLERYGTYRHGEGDQEVIATLSDRLKDGTPYGYPPIAEDIDVDKTLRKMLT